MYKLDKVSRNVFSLSILTLMVNIINEHPTNKILVFVLWTRNPLVKDTIHRGIER